MERIIFRPQLDNIFEFDFMNDFTTVELAKEEYGIAVSKLKFEDDFYCFSEKKSYTTKDLYEKFDIEIVENTDSKK